MNESSSSMWITRDIPLQVNFVENLSSFSMGLTQDFGVDVGSMVNPYMFNMNKQWKN